MSRILLVDDSPHAQRMGERILSEEGYEVVTVSNADSALVRMEDVDPDVILADTVMPGRSGYDICHFVKMSPRHRHVRVILTAGVLETIDEAQSQRVQADGSLKKPFEASALLNAVKPLAEAAVQARQGLEPGSGAGRPAPSPSLSALPFIAVVDAEQVRAAVTVALDAAMEKMVDEISLRVLETFKNRKPAAESMPAGTAAPIAAEPPRPAAPPPAAAHTETVRRVHAVRLRTGSILGLDIRRPEPESPAGDSETPSIQDE